MKSKKTVPVLLALLLIASLFSVMAFAEGTSEQKLPSDTSTSGSNEKTVSGWQGVYVTTNSSRTAGDIKTDLLISADTWWFAKIPGYGAKGAGFGEFDYTGSTIGNDCYAGMYIHDGQNKSVSTGENVDIGLSFTAPKTGKYRIDFSGTVPSYAGDASADGVKLLIYRNSFDVKIKEELITNTALTVDEGNLSLNAGDTLYFLFNKNNTIYSDTVSIAKLDVYFSVTPFEEIALPAADPPSVPVKKGTSFPHFFNIANEAHRVSLWKPFYLELGLLMDMAAGQGKYSIPGKTDINQYATIWEGVGNVFAPAQDYKIGEYFIAPVKGTVKVDCVFSYEADPGDNPASADGVGITLYQNSFANEIKARELFNYANSANGKSYVLENIAVNAGDKIIFLYDMNETAYSDGTRVNQMNIVYTDVEQESGVAPITPAAGKAAVDGENLKVLKTLTVDELSGHLALAGGCYAVFYDSDGFTVDDGSIPVTEADHVNIYNAAGGLMLSYKLLAVDTLDAADPSDGGNDDNTNTSDPVPVFLLILAASAAGCITAAKRRYSR